MATAAPAIADLLGACPALTVLANSQEPLHMRVEREYPVGPRALPDPRRVPPVDEIAQVPAVDLFVRRA